MGYFLSMLILIHLLFLIRIFLWIFLSLSLLQRRWFGNRGSTRCHKRKWSLGRMAGHAHGKSEWADSRIRSQRSHAHGRSAVTKGESISDSNRSADISLRSQFVTLYVISYSYNHSYVETRKKIKWIFNPWVAKNHFDSSVCSLCETTVSLNR